MAEKWYKFDENYKLTDSRRTQPLSKGNVKKSIPRHGHTIPRAKLVIKTKFEKQLEEKRHE